VKNIAPPKCMLFSVAVASSGGGKLAGGANRCYGYLGSRAAALAWLRFLPEEVRDRLDRVSAQLHRYPRAMEETMAESRNQAVGMPGRPR
jgi:hypothetical protein